MLSKESVVTEPHLLFEQPTRSFRDRGGSRTLPSKPRRSLPPLKQPIGRTGLSRIEQAMLRLDHAAHLHSKKPSAPVTAEAPACTPSQQLGAERRVFPRRGSVCFVHVHRKRDDSPVNQQQLAWLLHSTRLKGALVDISMNGIAFLLSEPIESGASVLLRLNNPRFDKHVDTTATVLRASRHDHEQWKIVCQFRQNLTFEQIYTLGQQLFESNLV